ncbi:MAG: amino acid adenylation domain-containing protein [Anaerolineae bacterium]|nr:amino acid adenylation domain-containing protein [Anaerolineae bacterium]
MSQDAFISPLSFAQERVWFLERLEPGRALYNVPEVTFRLRGPLDVAVLERSLNEIVRRHETLRTTFGQVDGRPVQVIHPSRQLTLPVVSLEHLPLEQREAEARRLAAEEVMRPFDLARGPLFRAVLLRLATDDHVLILPMHHIIADGWSIGILLRELAALYTAFSKGQPSPLPELPIQYADYAAWQRETLQGAFLEQEVAYWRQQLAGAPPVLELPTDRPRPAVQSYRGRRWRVTLPRQLLDGVKALSRAVGVTPFMTLLAAFQTLLYRYTGQEDIVVGTPIAGRNQPETQDLIGFFANTLVLRSDFSANPTFRELLEQVRQVALGAYEHQELPFEKLVAELSPVRDMSHSPLFQVLFVFQNWPFVPPELPGLEVSTFELGAGTTKFDLTLSLIEGEEGLTALFAYNTDLFDAATIERMAGHFQTLLEGVLADPDQRVATVPILRPAEREQLLFAWNDTERAYPQQCLHQLFEAQAARTPEAIAVLFPPGPSAPPSPWEGLREGLRPSSLTYDELNRRANQLARVLRQQGVGPETLAGLYVERSPEMIVGLLGILKAGGAYVPLDPSLPPERLAFLLEDTGVPLVLTQERLAHRLPQAVRTLRLDADWEAIAQESDHDLPCNAGPENLVYVIYTSGTTGLPKGVLVPHRALVNHALALAKAYGAGPGDRVLQFINLSFDAAAEEIFPTLLSGATLVLAPSAAELVGRRLMQFCEQQGIAILHLPAPVWHGTVDDLVASGRPMQAPLKVLLVGGESVDIERLRAWARLVDRPVKFLNAYGPTEATITATLFQTTCQVEAVSSLESVPIGRPIANVRVYVLDAHMQPVPVGVPGELYIGGPGLACGYLNRPDLTARSFVQNPFSKSGDSHFESDCHLTRLYKTGDLARYRPDGQLEFLGRTDDQVKIRGFRIELGEIRAVLAQHPGVREAVVVAREDTPGVKRLVAYVVPSDTALQPDELTAFLRSRLPEYMLPAAYVFLEELPLLPSGKVDRLALPAPESQAAEAGRGAEAQRPYVAPRDELEQHLAALWQELLGIEHISVHDDFFQLGGDSIQGAIFVNRLQEAMGEYVYLIAIFDAPTIAQLAAYLRENYPLGVARLLGRPADTVAPRPSPPAPSERIDQARVAHFRSLIRPLPPRDGVGPVGPPNPPAVFILSAPRSGSTLLRAMLGGHPRLFAPPELQLLNFNTLADQHAAFASERDSFWLDGSVRAIMALKHCSVEEARRILQTCVEQNLTVKQFYGLLQGWLGERIFVDKTPNYALDLAMLQRAESDFRDARYIALIRHPCAVISSFEKARLHVFYPPFLKGEHPYSVRQLAELVWVVSLQNIREFLRHVPAQRQHWLRYEDLVTHPRQAMEDICRFLGLDFHPDMLEPQKDPELRMTDALHPLARMVGDVRFHEHHGIDPRGADRWKEEFSADLLGEVTWQLAESLGYERPSPLPARAETLIEQADEDTLAQLLAELEGLSDDEAHRLWAGE